LELETESKGLPWHEGEHSRNMPSRVHPSEAHRATIFAGAKLPGLRSLGAR
jgi:hypothetical protein